MAEAVYIPTEIVQENALLCKQHFVRINACVDYMA